MKCEFSVHILNTWYYRKFNFSSTVFLSIDKHRTASFSFKEWNLLTAENVARGNEDLETTNTYSSGYLTLLVRKQLMGGAENTYIVPPLTAERYLKREIKVCIRFTAFC